MRPDAGARPGDVGALEEANLALYAAVESGDFDSMSELWVQAAGESAVCVHPGWPSVLGRGAILRSWALIMANTTYIQFFLTEVNVSVLGEVGVVTCQENILTGVGAGEGADGLSGGRVVTTNVFRREGPGWRLWMHHASPLLAQDSADGVGGDGVDESSEVADPPRDEEG